MKRAASSASPAAPGQDGTLARYRSKRNFTITPEPSPDGGNPSPKASPNAPPKASPRRRSKQAAATTALRFVIQKHWAMRLHYDFRLELDGVLMSWAVPKGPCFDPKEKRMAVHVEDHPVSYGGFEGRIPAKQYGAGDVIVWDDGTWEPVGDPRDGMAKGKLVFQLHGQKLAGLWELVRIAKPGDKQDPWMLFKKRDAWARPLAEYDVIAALPDSVIASPLGLVEAREPRGVATPTTEQPDLSAARKAKLPGSLAPQLATLAATAPQGPGWALEPKWDGYRILARIDHGRVQLMTRNGHDWTDKMPTLAAAVQALGLDSGWLDGEIVVLDDQGAPNFGALQHAIDTTPRSANGRRRRDERMQADRGADPSGAITYFVFDVPYLGGQDLRQVPLASRRAVLRQLFESRTSERVRFSPDFDAPVDQMLQAACAMRLEGLIAKRLDAPYVSARNDSWLKLKCVQRQEFVIVGYTDRRGVSGNAADEIGSLLLAVHEGGRLVHAGNVGTGWDHATARELHAALLPLATDQPAVDAKSVKPGRWGRRSAGGERWVHPQLVVEVAFAEWTADGHVRHASFQGLRSDKAPAEITREAASSAPPPSSAPRPSTRKVSHPDRVIDPSTGLKKIDLVRYYESVARWILPHLADRPVSLVRAPDGITGELFFQKHPETRMPGLKVLDAALWPGHAPLLAIDSEDALVAAAQMNVVEFHTWNSTARHIDQPDRVVFDLDPGEGVAWPAVQEAATLVRALLDALGLQSWLKTSGGKGLHVVVPVQPKLDDEAVKAFSQAAVQHMAKTIPQKFVARSGGTNRVGKIFIDYLRNGRAQTTAAAFSARSRPGLGVSMPVAWEQLPALKGGAQWTIATAREHLSFETADPWAGYWKSRQTLTAAIKQLGAAARA